MISPAKKNLLSNFVITMRNIYTIITLAEWVIIISSNTVVCVRVYVRARV
jgi:hypothetical protein